MVERTARARGTLATARTVVVKVGTNVLTSPGGRLDEGVVTALAEQLADLCAAGRRVTLVTSGAVSAGMAALGLAQRPTEMPLLQACASVGQPRLMAAYQQAFSDRGLACAQLLLTRADFDDRRRYLNIRRCLAALHDQRALPIVNENDTVSTEEIGFGDNDVLASLAANLLRAEACVFLTSAPGLLDPHGHVVPAVDDLAGVLDFAQQTRSALGRGGMQSKLRWAAAVSHAGEVAVIASGREPAVLAKILSGQPVGTLLLPTRGDVGKPGKLSSRARWIGLTARPRGALVVDAGAAERVRLGRSSLLPVGVRQVTGVFAAGEVVAVLDDQGNEIARGIARHDSARAASLVGLRSTAVAERVGADAPHELIHRSDLVVTVTAS